MTQFLWPNVLNEEVSTYKIPVHLGAHGGAMSINLVFLPVSTPNTTLVVVEAGVAQLLPSWQKIVIPAI